MNWIEIDTVLDIHERIIDATGGDSGIRDKDLLESALNSPMATFGGKELHSGLLTKVAVLLFKLTNNHPFVDGNKRTAFVTAATILASNGYEIHANQQEVVQLMLQVADSRADYEHIEQWLTTNIAEK